MKMRPCQQQRFLHEYKDVLTTTPISMMNLMEAVTLQRLSR